MAWGLWNKIKKGFQKIGRGIKAGLGWVNNKIIKPVLKPIANVAAPIVNKFLPGAGAFVKPITDVVSDGIDVITGEQKLGDAWGKNRDTVKGWVNKMKG